MIAAITPSPSKSPLLEAGFSALCSQLREQVQGGMPGTLAPLEKYASSLERFRAQIADFSEVTISPRFNPLESAETLAGKVAALREPLNEFFAARGQTFPAAAFQTITDLIDRANSIEPELIVSAAGVDPRTELLKTLENACSSVNQLLQQERLATAGNGTTLMQLYEGNGDGRAMRKHLNAATGKLHEVLQKLTKFTTNSSKG